MSLLRAWTTLDMSTPGSLNCCMTWVMSPNGFAKLFGVASFFMIIPLVGTRKPHGGTTCGREGGKCAACRAKVLRTEVGNGRSPRSGSAHARLVVVHELADEPGRGAHAM